MATNLSEKASFVCDTAGKSLTVYIRGEIDHHTAVSVRNGIDAILFEKRPSQLRLDLSGVGFMDSSGLGLIMGRLSVMKNLGGGVLLLNPSPETMRILSLAGMERLVPIAHTKENVSEDKPCASRENRHAPLGGASRRREKKADPSA